MTQNKVIEVEEFWKVYQENQLYQSKLKDYYLRTFPFCDLQESFQTSMIIDFIWKETIHLWESQPIFLVIITATDKFQIRH